MPTRACVRVPQGGSPDELAGQRTDTATGKGARLAPCLAAGDGADQRADQEKGQHEREAVFHRVRHVSFLRCSGLNVFQS